MDAPEVVAVLDALDAAGIRSGMTGGWGVDALLRRRTRPHRDVDLGVPCEAVQAAIDALAPLGYVMTVDERPARLVLQGERGHVDLHPIAWDRSGHGTQTGFDGATFEYPPGSLDAEGEIDGRIVRCATPALQLAFHRGYEPGDHDRRDMAALGRAFGLTLPPPYAT
jgi:lincosamide nucleotidyltransferase A/C/D/E